MYTYYNARTEDRSVQWQTFHSFRFVKLYTPNENMANPENQWLIERKIHRRCLTEQRVTESDADRLGVGVVLESSLAKLATDTLSLIHI